MPIIVRQLDTTPGMVASGDDVAVDGQRPPVDLLPSGGGSAPAPASAPDRALALDALSVIRFFRDRPRDAGLWGEPAFAREVERVRADLAPIISRRGLAASFGREAAASAGVRAAYAVRWLELGDGNPRPRWPGLGIGRD